MAFEARGRAERNKTLCVIFFLGTRQWLLKCSQSWAVWWCRLIRLAMTGQPLRAASCCIQTLEWMLENQANFLIFTRGDEVDDILYWWHHASFQMWTERKESVRWIFHISQWNPQYWGGTQSCEPQHTEVPQNKGQKEAMQNPVQFWVKIPGSGNREQIP